MDASFSTPAGEPEALQPEVGTATTLDDDGVTAAGGVQWNPLTAAALVGGAVAAGAGAYLGAKALKRRNAGKDGRINSAMSAAITANEAARGDK
jgi:hypothetical protein